MDLDNKILKYAKWLIEESSNPVSEIEWLITDLLDTDKREEYKNMLDYIIEKNNL